MARRPFRGPASALRQGQRRKTTWIGIADQAFVSVSANSSAIIQSFEIDGNFDEPITVVRVRGALQVVPQTFATDQNIIGALGVGIVSDQAFAAGAASIPGPWTNSSWDGWFLWQPVTYFFEVTTDIGRLVFPQFTLDSKAMRKVEANETIVTMFESQGPAVSVSAPTRLLIKLS